MLPISSDLGRCGWFFSSFFHVNQAPSPFQAPKAAVAAALAPKEPAEMEMEIDDEMTVEQYLRHQCEMQTHQLIRACESRMTEFQEAAAGFRGQIEAH